MPVVHGRTRWEPAAAVLRAVLSAVLLFGGLTAVQYRWEQPGTLTRLYEDLRSQRVDVLEYEHRVDGESYHLSARWSTGPFSWWALDEVGQMKPASQEVLEVFPEARNWNRGSDFENVLRRAADTRKIEIRPYQREQISTRFWIQGVSSGWAGAPTAMVALALLALMLATRDHRYANRWAWFWLFLSSPLGMIGYLWLERRPFPPSLPPHAQAPVRGGKGFLLSLALSILFAFLVLLVSWLVT